MKQDLFWKGFVFYFTTFMSVALIVAICLLIPDLRSGSAYWWLLGFNLTAIAALVFMHYCEFVDNGVYDTYSAKRIIGYHRISQLLRHIPYFRNKRIRYYRDMRFIISALQKAPSEDVFLQSVLKEIGN